MARNAQRPSKYDAIVVGAGIAGLGAAYGLVLQKKKVLILTRQKKIAGESTPASAGILDPFLESSSPKHPFFKLKRAAFLELPKEIKKIEKLSGLSTGYQRTGVLFAALTARETKVLKARFQRHRGAGIPLEWVDPKTALTRWPYLSKHVRRVLYYPTLGRVFPAKLQRSLHRALNKSGVQTVAVSGPVKTVLRHNQVVGIKAGKHFFESSHVVNACGSWADQASLSPLKFPVYPVRGQVTVVRGQVKSLSQVVHSADGNYVVPWEKGTYLLGATVENKGFLPYVDAKSLGSIRRSAESVIPKIQSLKRGHSWAGLRPCTNDQRPLLGKTAIKGYYMASGYYRSGVVISIYAGRLLAKVISGRGFAKELRFFDPMRFSKKITSLKKNRR